MKKIMFFCEGVTDQVFLADCLEFFFGIKCARAISNKAPLSINITFNDGSKIVAIDGCDKLKKDIYINMLKDNQDEGGVNIVIFDADFYDPESKTKLGNNGFISASQKLRKIKEDHNVNFEFYLWHNDGEDGKIENLIWQLIPADKKNIFDCIVSHQDCLKNCNHPNIKIADLKQQINFYVYTMTATSDLAKRDYKDKKYWNLDFEKIRDLQKLKDYIKNICGFEDITQTA